MKLKPKPIRPKASLRVTNVVIYAHTREKLVRLKMATGWSMTKIIEQAVDAIEEEVPHAKR